MMKQQIIKRFLTILPVIALLLTAISVSAWQLNKRKWRTGEPVPSVAKINRQSGTVPDYVADAIEDDYRANWGCAYVGRFEVEKGFSNVYCVDYYIGE